MRLGPTDELLKGGDERLASVGETVLHARRHLGVNGARDQPVGFHLAQVAGEHFLRNSGHRAAKFAKAARSLREVSQDEHLPLAANEQQRCLHWARG